MLDDPRSSGLPERCIDALDLCVSSLTSLQDMSTLERLGFLPASASAGAAIAGAAPGEVTGEAAGRAASDHQQRHQPHALRAGELEAEALPLPPPLETHLGPARFGCPSNGGKWALRGEPPLLQHQWHLNLPPLMQQLLPLQQPQLASPWSSLPWAWASWSPP